MAAATFTKHRAKAAALALYRLANPTGGDPPGEYLDMPAKDLHKVIATYLGIRVFDGNKDSLLSLATRFGIQTSPDMTNVQVLVAIDDAVRRVWEARDPPPTVKFGGEGRFNDVEMDAQPLREDMGMDPVQAETNFLLSGPKISKEEFGRRATILIATPGFDTRYTEMLRTAHLNCEAFNPSQRAAKYLQTSKRFVEAEKVVTATEALDQATRQHDAALKVYRKFAGKVGFEISPNVDPFETCDAAMKHCDEIIASAADPAILALNAENERMLAEFEAMGLLDED